MRAGARARLEQRLTQAWTTRGPLACALWPLSQIYGALAALRRALYRTRVLQAERLPLPVVVVGNVVAGGAGKTPTTLAVALHLRARGWRPGIVSRGHGRRTTDVREVAPDADPRDVGDEPLLLRRRAGVPVAVGARRAAAGRALLAAHPEVDVLVCDDGLQHLALARDVEIAVFDARGIGNGWLRPAGPLREPWPRPVDLMLATEVPAPGTFGPAEPAFSATRQLAEHALRADGSTVPLRTLQATPLTAVAGIARPQAFFDLLRQAGLALADTVALPDHYDFNSWSRTTGAEQTLICTEKDAMKLWRHRPDALAVPLQLQVPAAFFAALDERLAARGYHPRQRA
ncbi:MAG: tetraacyldisaccharide 4'-kinase [Burkholderiales bacterium]|nr:tetraacyldisaccharide 4'-kinase [Burkholderiales bacterium]